jgi:FkbM family methyltransferase
MLASLYLAVLIKIRQWLIRLAHDPVITFSFHGTPLHLNLSHNLPLHVRSYPDYALNLGEVVRGVLRKYPQATVIDIGANIGDSVAILKCIQDVPILCIEGDSHYFGLLQQNVRPYTHVTLAHSFIGQAGDQATLAKAGGTGQLLKQPQAVSAAQSISLQPLAEILETHAPFSSAKVLKIDTDGMDIEILRSAESWLKLARPILFIEYFPQLMPSDQRDPVQFISFLRRNGYGYGIVFLNTGEMLISFNLKNTVEDSVLIDLHYFSLNSPQNTFYDLCLLHETDADVFHTIYQHFHTKRMG